MSTIFGTPIDFKPSAELRQMARILNIKNDLSTPRATLITAIKAA